MPVLLVSANFVIAACYFAIATLVGHQLWQVRGHRLNVLGLATFGIFLTCGLGHGLHVLSYMSGLLSSESSAGALVQLICSVVGVPAQAATATIGQAHEFGASAHSSAGLAQTQLVVDLLTIIPAISFLALRSRYGLLAEGEAVILDYQQTIHDQHAIVAERTAALAMAEAHARELAEAQARTEQAALALQASERRFRLLAENARDIIYRYQLGEQPNFEYVSPVVADVLGYPPEAWYANPHLLAQLMHADDRPLWEALMRDPADLATPLIYRCVRSDGAVVWLEQQTAVVAGATPAAPAIECVARDITERVQAQAAQRELEHKLHDAQRLESIGVLAGGIAHDFNNLLTGILGNADLALLDIPAGSDLRQVIEPIKSAGQHAADLTRQMLAYAGKGKYVVDHTGLNSLIQDMRELLNMSIFKRCALTFQLSSAQMIEVDVTQMRQVIMNLLLNAAEALGDRDGVVMVSTCDAALTRAQLDQMIGGSELQPGLFAGLEVRDTGCGMDAATITRVFEPFFTTKFTGRGLGLSAVQGIMRSHLGALHVTSAPNMGTTFQIWLPASGAQTPALRSPKQPPAPSYQGAILLVDDEESVRAVTRTMLERLGFVVHAAADGPTGLALLPAVPALRGMLLDLTMPGMNGDAVVRAVRARRATLPLVLMSGYSAIELAQQYADLGITSFLQKPFTFEALQSALREASMQAGAHAALL